MLQNHCFCSAVFIFDNSLFWLAKLLFFLSNYFIFQKAHLFFIFLCTHMRPWIASSSSAEWFVMCVTAQSITWTNRRDSSWTNWIRWGSEWSAWQESVRRWSGVSIKRRVTRCDSAGKHGEPGEEGYSSEEISQTHEDETTDYSNLKACSVSNRSQLAILPSMCFLWFMVFGLWL